MKPRRTLENVFAHSLEIPNQAAAELHNFDDS